MNESVCIQPFRIFRNPTYHRLLQFSDFSQRIGKEPFQLLGASLGHSNFLESFQIYSLSQFLDLQSLESLEKKRSRLEHAPLSTIASTPPNYPARTHNPYQQGYNIMVRITTRNKGTNNDNKYHIHKVIPTQLDVQCIPSSACRKRINNELKAPTVCRILVCRATPCLSPRLLHEALAFARERRPQMAATDGIMGLHKNKKGYRRISDPAAEENVYSRNLNTSPVALELSCCWNWNEP